MYKRQEHPGKEQVEPDASHDDTEAEKGNGHGGTEEGSQVHAETYNGQIHKAKEQAKDVYKRQSYSSLLVFVKDLVTACEGCVD